MRNRSKNVVAGVLAGSAALLVVQPVAAMVQDSWTSVRYNDGEMETGSGVRASEARNVSGFREIVVQSAADLTITQGSRTSLTITTDDNLLDNITTEVEDGVLVISSEGSYRTRLGVNAALTVADLDEVRVQGSGDIVFTDWRGDAIRLHVQGSGDIDLNGRVRAIDAHVQGSGDIDLRQASAGTVDALVQGSGDIRTGSPQRLAAVVQGSGDIRYAGNPEFTQRLVQGTGDITRN